MTATSSTSYAPAPAQHIGSAPAKLASVAKQDREGDFGEILAGRRALLSSSQALTSPDARGDAAPAAGEFGALRLFQDPVTSAQQSVGFTRQATSSPAAPAVAGMASSNIAVTVSDDEAAAPDLDILPDQDATFARGPADPINPGGRGLTQVLPGQGIIPAAGSAVQARPAAQAGALPDVPSARPVRSGGAEPDAIALPGSRRQAALPAEPAAMTLGLFADGKEGAVASRIAGLGSAEAEELRGRIRDELAASRLGAREIRINGRLSGPPQENE